MKKRIYLASIFMLVALVGCTNEDELGQMTNAESEVAITVNGTVNNLATARATTDDTSTFESNNEIGVSVSDGSYTNVKYTYGENSFSATSTVVYVSTNSTSTLYAYYPYQSSGYTVGTTSSSDSTDDSSSDSTGDTVEFTVNGATDVLYSSADADTYGSVSFTFSHKMAKVNLNVSGTFISSASSITLGVYNIPSTVTLSMSDGTLNSGSSTTSLSSSLTVSNSAASTALILPAGTYTSAVPVTITVDEVEYTGSISAPTWTAGYSYTYNITVAATSANTTQLSISAESSVSGWNSDGTKADVTVESDPGLEVGDYLLSDGSILDKRTVDLSTYTATNASTTIVGVVFSVYSDDKDEKANSSSLFFDDYEIAEEANAGLAIAIVESPYKVYFQSSTAYTSGEYTCYNVSWYWDENDYGGVYPGYSVLPSGVTVGSPDETGSTTYSYGSNYSNADNIYLGYNNTALWKKFATNKSYSYGILTSLESWNGTEVSGCSSWYIPSKAEAMALLEEGDGSSTTYVVNSDIAQSLSNAGDGDADFTKGFWLSTDGIYSYGATNLGSYGKYWKATSTGNGYTFTNQSMKKDWYFRPAIAFGVTEKSSSSDSSSSD